MKSSMVRGNGDLVRYLGQKGGKPKAAKPKKWKVELLITDVPTAERQPLTRKELVETLRMLNQPDAGVVIKVTGCDEVKPGVL